MRKGKEFPFLPFVPHSKNRKSKKGGYYIARVNLTLWLVGRLEFEKFEIDRSDSLFFFFFFFFLFGCAGRRGGLWWRRDAVEWHSLGSVRFKLQVPHKKYLNIWTENRDNTRIIQGYFRDISEVRHLLEVSVHRLTGGILVRIS